jgi:lactoylglutathione lyase
MTSRTGQFRLLHTMLRVKDLDAALDFYTNKLGTRLLRKTDFPGGEFTLAFVGYADEESPRCSS